MEDSGIASFSVSGSVDVSLEGLDISATNPSETTCRTEETTAVTTTVASLDSLPIISGGTEEQSGTEDSALMQSTVQFAPENASIDMQR